MELDAWREKSMVSISDWTGEREGSRGRAENVTDEMIIVLTPYFLARVECALDTLYR